MTLWPVSLSQISDGNIHDFRASVRAVFAAAGGSAAQTYEKWRGRETWLMVPEWDAGSFHLSLKKKCLHHTSVEDVSCWCKSCPQKLNAIFLFAHLSYIFIRVKIATQLLNRCNRRKKSLFLTIYWSCLHGGLITYTWVKWFDGLITCTCTADHTHMTAWSSAPDALIMCTRRADHVPDHMPDHMPDHVPDHMQMHGWSRAPDGLITCTCTAQPLMIFLSTPPLTFLLWT